MATSFFFPESQALVMGVKLMATSETKLNDCTQRNYCFSKCLSKKSRKNHDHSKLHLPYLHTSSKIVQGFLVFPDQ